MKKIFVTVSICLLCYLPISSMAWGVLGHRIVGEIAESYLSPKAKLAIKKILGNESMAIASNWADFVKSDTAYKYLNNWHYINLSEGFSEQQVKDYLLKDTSVNAFTKIKLMVAALKNSSLNMETKRMYVRLLIHIVGDVHQPMHVSHEEDYGGNKIKVTWFGQNTNLHAVWDEKLIDMQQLSYTEYTKTINYTTPEQVKLWQREPMDSWFYQSYQLAEKLYKEVKQTPEPKFSFKYNYDHIQQVNDALLKGGVHLAGLLNEIFG